MELPFAIGLNMSHAAQMVAAVLTGIGFGFVLSRAGFDRADNMASIFYGRDFRVMRVMFTAIVTAMLGLYLLDLVGVMPISQIGLLPTYFVPQLVGGAMLGVGFVMGGYCPGTSIVATVSGKIDAMFFVGGLFFGGLLFIVGYDAFSAMHQSGARGRILLHELFGIPSGVMVALVVAFAIGALAAVSRIEAMVLARLGRKPEAT